MNDVVMSENNSVLSLSENEIFAFGGYTDLEHVVVVIIVIVVAAAVVVVVLFMLLFLLFLLCNITLYVLLLG